MSTQEPSAEDTHTGLGSMIRWTAGLFILLYLITAGWSAYQFQSGLYVHLLWSSSALLTLALTLSLWSASVHYRKVRWVKGVERHTEGDGQRSQGAQRSWIEGFGDRGMAMINLIALGVHLPILIGLNHDLDLELFGRDSLSIFTVPLEGVSRSHDLLTWLYFLVAQCVPINTALELCQTYLMDLHVAQWVAQDRGLSELLTPVGEATMFLMNILILSLLLESLYRRQDLRGMLSAQLSAVSLSALMLDEHERAHLSAFHQSHDQGVSLAERQRLETQRAEALSVQEERAHELISRQRSLAQFLSIFPKPFLRRALSLAVRDHGRGVIARASILSASLESPLRRRRLRGPTHPFGPLAFEVLCHSRAPQLKRASLLSAELWASPAQREAVIQEARKVAQQSSAQGGSLAKSLDQERLTLASTVALISQGDLSSLNVMIGGLRSPSPLIRGESLSLFLGLARTLGEHADTTASVRLTLDHISSLLHLYHETERSRGRDELLKERLHALYLALSEARTEERSDPRSYALCAFVIDLTLTEIGGALSKPSLISESYKLLSLGRPEHVARELWAILSVRPLDEGVRRELFEGLIQRPALNSALIQVTRHALREGTYQERIATARLYGEALYHHSLHQVLLEELEERLELSQRSPGQLELLFELICSLGRLCAVERLNIPLRERSVALLSIPLTERGFTGASAERLEVARRYALSFLTPSDLFVSLFEWGTGLPPLFELELDQAEEVALVEALTEEVTARMRRPAFELLCVDQPRVSVFLSRSERLRSATSRGEPFSLDEEALSYLRSSLWSKHEVTIPAPGEDLGVLWVNALATQTKRSPSATTLLLTLALLDSSYPVAIQRATLRKLKQHQAFFKRSMLGPLAHRSFSEWVSLRITSLLRTLPTQDRMWGSLVLNLGAYKCEHSTETLRALLKDQRLNARALKAVTKALGQQGGEEQLEALQDAYQTTASVQVRSAVIEALSRAKGDLADELLITLIKASVEGTGPALNNEAFTHAFKRLKQLGALELVTPLYAELSEQSPELQKALFKAYRGAPFGDLELTRSLWSVALGIIKNDASRVELLRAVVRALPVLKAQLERQLDPRVYPEELEALYGSTHVALKLAVNARSLSPVALGDFAESISLLTPSQALSWLEMKLQSADIQQSSQLIASVANVSPERFVELATDHLERYSGALRAGGFSPSCVHRLSHPFLRYAGREGIAYIKRLVYDLNPAYSPYLVHALQAHGDSHSDRSWLEELAYALRDERLEQGRVRAKMETALLSTLHAFDHPRALSTLVELALMETRSEAEDKLQQEALTILEGFEDLEAELFIHRDEDNESGGRHT